MQTPFDDSLYNGYTNNYWAAKVPSPLGTKTFPWGLNSVNPHLSSVVSTQPMCFSNPASSISSTMVGNMPSVPANMSNTGAPCPYAPPAPPYIYSPNRDQCSSSIASLRLKAKHHSTSFGYPPVNHRQPTLSACQYATVGNSGGVWERYRGITVVVEDRYCLTRSRDNHVNNWKRDWKCWMMDVNRRA